MASCAAALPATRATARPASIELRVRDLIGVSIGCRAWRARAQLPASLGARPCRHKIAFALGPAVDSGRPALEPRDNLLCHGFDLFLFVLVGHENDAIDAGRQVRLELLHALLRRAHD